MTQTSRGELIGINIVLGIFAAITTTGFMIQQNKVDTIRAAYEHEDTIGPLSSEFRQVIEEEVGRHPYMRWLNDRPETGHGRGVADDGSFVKDRNGDVSITPYRAREK